MKYIACALIGAAAMAIVFYTAPALLPVLVGAAVVKWATVVGFGLLAGVGMGMVVTGLREYLDAYHDHNLDWKAPLKAAMKVGVGAVLASPLLLLFGLYQGVGLVATAGYMIGAAAGAFMAGFMLTSVVAKIAERCGYTPSLSSDDGVVDSRGKLPEQHPVPLTDGGNPKATGATLTREQRLAILQSAIDRGDADTVRVQMDSLPILAESKLKKGSNEYPLLAYVFKGCVVRDRAAVVKAILHYDLLINQAVDERGNTALHFAVMYGDAACVNAILAYKPRSREMESLNLSVENTEGMTAWDLAQLWPAEHEVHVAMKAAHEAQSAGLAAAASPRQ